MLGRRPNDDSSASIQFTFMTVHSWMENPVGEWIIEVCDSPGEEDDSENTIHFNR